MRNFLVLLVAASALPAQQLDTQALSASVRTLRRTAQVSDEVKAKADKLIADSQTGDTRRRMANALALLKGETWDRSANGPGLWSSGPIRPWAIPRRPSSLGSRNSIRRVTIPPLA